MEDELHKFENLKYDFDYGVRFASREHIDDKLKLIGWLQMNITSLQNYVQSANNLMNNAFKHFFGEPGVPADIKGLYYVASRLAKTFQELIEWHNNVMSTSIESDFINLRDCFGKYTLDAAFKIWEFPTLIKNKINTTLETISEKKGEPVVINITLNIIIDQKIVDDFNKELDRLKLSSN